MIAVDFTREAALMVEVLCAEDAHPDLIEVCLRSWWRLVGPALTVDQAQAVCEDLALRRAFPGHVILQSIALDEA